VRDLNLGLPMPALPLRVGLITSQGSDAAHDFLDELRRSGYGFEVSLYDARMQGKALEKTVVAGFEHFARAGGVDVVALVRGGGARSDLAHFNTLPIALAVCRHPVPVVCGVGHHLDQCVVDDLARSLKTPTAAAQFLVSLVREAVAELDNAVTSLRAGVRRCADLRRAELQQEGRALEQHSRKGLSEAHRSLIHLAAQLGHGAAAQLKGSARALHELEGRLPASVELRLGRERRQMDAVRGSLDFARVARKLARRKLDLDEARERLAKALRAVKARAKELDAHRQSLVRVARALHARRSELDQAQQRLRRASVALTQRQGEVLERLELRREAADPARVLARGFALVRDEHGKTVRRASEVLADARLVVSLAQGVLGVRVEDEG
jgi:exodeoxyribonuclease VII large subunit